MTTTMAPSPDAYPLNEAEIDFVGSIRSEYVLGALEFEITYPKTGAKLIKYHRNPHSNSDIGNAPSDQIDIIPVHLVGLHGYTLNSGKVDYAMRFRVKDSAFAFALDKNQIAHRVSITTNTKYIVELLDRKTGLPQFGYWAINGSYVSQSDLLEIDVATQGVNGVIIVECDTRADIGP
ncbi:hypothetical protein [Serratia fonticola]|uniref:hypothetical protein n=1 Tax=Serratia fonticola TaxID=47917 RepID=UPI00301E3F89